MTAGGVTVPGVPVPQGSKKAIAFIPKGGGRPRASVVDDNKAELTRWRAVGARVIREWMPDKNVWAGPLFAPQVPVALRCRFVFGYRQEDVARIRRFGRENGPPCACRPGCVHMPWHVVSPDKDKCLRAVFDLLTLAGVWHDDGQCCLVEFVAYRSADPCTVIEWVDLPH